MHPDGITWHDANEYCVDQGTSLLAIESGEENNKIKTHLLQNEGKPGTFSITNLKNKRIRIACIMTQSAQINENQLTIWNFSISTLLSWFVKNILCIDVKKKNNLGIKVVHLFCC